MMKLFCVALLAGCLCCGSARSGVRMVDVVEDMVEDDAFARAVETISSRVKDSASCKKVVEELNREADRLEKLWRKAFMSGEPTTREWCRMADAEVRLYRKLEERWEKDGEEKTVSLSELENDGVITHEEAEEGFAALGRLMWVSKTAIDSLDDLIAGAELPLPSSPDGDSYEKLLVWKLTPEYSLSSMMRNDPLVNGRLEKALESCWNDGVLEMMKDAVSRISRERKFLLIRRSADRKVEETERISKLPPLTPEQWCWLQKQEHDPQLMGNSIGDLLTVFPLLLKQDEGEKADPLEEETIQYWMSFPARRARVWREKLRKEEGR